MLISSMLLYSRIRYKITGSDDDEEGSLLFELNVLVDQYDFLELSVVYDLCSQVVEVERLSDLISEFSVDGHCFDLNITSLTLRFMVAPESRSPNL